MAIEKSKHSEKFYSFERAGWSETIAAYDGTFGQVTRQSADATLDAANVGPGMLILDVCTGPGMLAAAAIARGALAVGLDFAPEVVALARKHVPAGEFHQGDAQNLPFPDAGFDAVVCGYGIMHVPEPEKALREMLRVVRPGRRVSISVWDSTAPTTGFGLIYAAVRAHGKLDVALPHGPDFFQFGTPEKMRSALREIGFSQVTANPFEQYWRVASASDVIDAIATGTVRARALLAAQESASLPKIRQFIADALKGLQDGTGGYRVPLPAIIGSGEK